MPRLPENPKKKECLALRAQGLTYSQIAHKLQVKNGTVAGWIGMAKRKREAKESRDLQAKHGNNAFIPQTPSNSSQSNEHQPIGNNTGAEFKNPRLSPLENNAESGEQALRAEAFQILADGLRGKHHAKSKREWADKIIKATSKEKVSVIGKRGSTSQPDSKTTYSGMGDAELAERGIMGSVALVGGLAVEEIIKRLKDQGQFYI